MEQQYATPIRHSSFSAAANTTAGAAGGAVKYGLGSAVAWIGVLTLVGVAIGVTVATGGLSAILGTAAGASAGGSGLLGLITSGTTWGALIGGGLGLGFGFGTSWIPGGLGALVGGLKGGAKASARVSNERAAAADLQTQIAMAQAQAYTPQMADNDNKYGFPGQGAPMNPAMRDIQLGTAQYDGTATGRQRAAGL